MYSTPMRCRVNASDKQIEAFKEKFSGAAPGEVVQVAFGTKTLEFVKDGDEASAQVTVTVTSAGDPVPPKSAPTPPAEVTTMNKRKHRGGKPQELMFNKMMNALFDEYSRLKGEFCQRRVERMGGNPKDILLGNKTLVFSKFRKEFVDLNQQRKEYYYADTPPTTFDEEGTVWLKKYWHRVAKDRPPRDRALEKRKREMKKRATSAQGGSVTAADDMYDDGDV